MLSPSASLKASAGQLTIEFKAITVTVTDRASGTRKDILSDAYGLLQPGRLSAIMGPSGAGKSTLLDVLACNSQASSHGATVGGEVLVNGILRSRRDFAKRSCYVQQKDVLLSTATVREALLTSALLKLPISVPLERKRQLVEGVLQELDLLGCASTLIGDESIGLKGISGGQKRRVSVGVELVKDPRVIFLDEPTSGLDSEMAVSVVESLVALARKQRTVVCTIHQPNSDITDLFDDFMLLGAGRVVYGGVWSGAVDFFNRAGYSCPNYKNPTDYFMSVVTRDPTAVPTLADAYAKARAGLLAQQASARWQARPAPSAGGVNGSSRYSLVSPGSASKPSMPLLPAPAGCRSSVGEEGPAEQGGALQGGGPSGGGKVEEGGPAVAAADGCGPSIQGFVALDVEAAAAGVSPGKGGAGGAGSWRDSGLADAAGGEGEGEVVETTTTVPLWYQAYVLSVRYWRTWLRNPMLMSSELLQYLLLGVFIGLMYYRFNKVLGEGDFDRMACVWFIFAVLSFTPSYTAVTSWEKERLLLKRELGQKQYSVTAYYIARYSVIIPFEVLECLLFTIIVYFFVGFYPSAANFFTFFAVLAMFQIISEGIGACCAMVTSQALYGVMLLSLIILLLLSFSGFLVTKVPVYFVWVQKASYLTYAFSALVGHEFQQITFSDPAAGGAPVPGMDAMPPSLDTGLSFSQNVGVLAAQVAGMEVVKLTALHVSHRFSLM